MRKIFVTFHFGIICICSQAQRSIEGLIRAEKSFAAYSVAKGTKEAFLKFTDSAGIVID